MAGQGNPQAENSNGQYPADMDAMPGLVPVKTTTGSNSTKAPFDIDLQFNLWDSIGNGSYTGVAWLDSVFWITEWNGDTIIEMTATGTELSRFAVPGGPTNIRSLTYDGSSVYAGGAGQEIWEIDPSTKTLTSTITFSAPGVDARMCAYDPNADGGNGGFWIGDFTSDIILLSKTGTILTTIAQTTHGYTGIYGGAVDTATAGGPYLLVYYQGGASQNTIGWLDIASGLPTGINYNVNNDLAVNGIAGGLFVATDIIPGEQHIVTITQETTTAGNVLTAYEAGFSPALAAFNLVTPSTGTRLAIDNNSLGNTVVIDWDATSELNGSAITYEWLLDGAGGDFSNPLAVLPSDNGGADTTLTLTLGAIDTLLISLGIGEGDSVEAIWTVRATTGFGNDDLAANGPFDIKFVRDQVVSLSGSEIASAISVFPNPANDRVTIELNSDEPTSLTLLDVFGKVMDEVETSTYANKMLEYMLPEGITNGTYLIRAENESGISVFRIQVQK